MDDRQELLERISVLEAENAERRQRLAQLEHQLQNIHQRRKKTRAQKDPNRSRRDRRRKKYRKHPGSFRPAPPTGTQFIEHEVHPKQCAHCGGDDLEATGQFEDHIVADIPEPKIEWHRYRRHIYRCRCRARGLQEANP
jgi:zinc-finger binding domain of transposase IS66